LKLKKYKYLFFVDFESIVYLVQNAFGI